MNCRFAFTAATAVACAAMTACGGGGDEAAAAAPLYELTADNHWEVAGVLGATGDDAEDNVQGVRSLIDQLPGSALTGAAAADRALSVVQAAASLERAQLVRTRAFESCTSGSSTVAVDDANNNGLLDGGDAITATYINCVLNGETRSGQTKVKLNSSSGSLAQGSTNYSVDLDWASQWTVNFDDGERSVFKMTFHATAHRVAAESGRDALTGSVSVSGADPQGEAFNGAITDMSVVIDRTPETVTRTMNHDLTSSALNGQRLQIRTLTPFVAANVSGAAPRSGVMQATGANGRSVTLSALGNATQVEVRADLNGDGVGDGEHTYTVRWSDLP